MATFADVLQEAHDLIEAGDYQAARQMLNRIQAENENNPDYWWVYAHATEDATEGKQAIERVRQLAPNYAGLESFGTSPSRIQSLRPNAAPPPPMAMASSAASEDDEFSDTGTESSGRSPLAMLMPIGVFAILVLVLLAILSISGVFNFGGGEVTPAPTEFVDNFTPVVPTSDSQAAPSEEATEPIETEEAVETEIVAVVTEEEETEEPVPTETVSVTTEEVIEIETEEAVETETVEIDPFADVMDELAAFAVPVDGISTTETSLGETLTITSCSTPGPAATSNIVGIVDALNEAGIELETDALAVAITDCESDTVTLVLGLTADVLASYWAGDSTESELIAALRRIG